MNSISSQHQIGKELKTTFSLLALIAGLTMLCVGVAGYLLGRGSLDEVSTSAPLPTNEAIMCTMDVMECPDGSFVARQGPLCAFAPCASISNTGSLEDWKEYVHPSSTYRFHYPPTWTVSLGSSSADQSNTLFLQHKDSTEKESVPSDTAYQFVYFPIQEGIITRLKALIVSYQKTTALKSTSQPELSAIQIGNLPTYEVRFTDLSGKETYIVLGTQVNEQFGVTLSGSTTELPLLKEVLSSFVFSTPFAQPN